ncbi:hypothetical protein C3L33_23139, partial [Rhododendron williamsianum]
MQMWARAGDGWARAGDGWAMVARAGDGNFIRDEEVSKYLQLAARYRSSSHILSAVADFLDMMNGFTLQEETNTVRLHPELKAEKAAESLCIFAENLCQSDKLIRISTLRILSHYQLLNYEHSPKEEPTQENMKTEVSHTCFADDRGCNVLRLLLSIEDTPVSVTTMERFHFFLSPASDNNPCATVLSLLIRSLQKVPGVIESHSQQLVPLFLKFMGYNLYDLVNGGTFKAQAFKGKEWKNILKEWLTLLKSLRHPKSFYRSQFLKDVLQYRLLDENDAEIQMMVLDCLLNWKDDFLHTSVHHRKAVLWFIAQLDVDELRLFFALLINPLLSTSRGFDGMGVWFLSSSEWSKKEFDSFSVLKYFTRDNAMALSWKKRYAFLQVIEDILGVFGELHVKPYLNLLMGCVVSMLSSCTSIIDSGSSGFPVVETPSSFRDMHERGGGAENQIMTSTAVKQFKELRSLCLKIISWVLNKYDDHEFGCEFWNLFFDSVKPLVNGFKQECASSAKPSSLFSCFLSMSGSYKLVWLLHREKSIVSDIFSILTVPTASEAILSCVLKFVENLLNLDSVCVEALNVIRQMIPVVGSESTTKILNAVSPLLASVSLDVRMSVCDLLAGTDSSLVTVAELVRDLNSTFAMEMGGLDYDGMDRSITGNGVEASKCAKPSSLRALCGEDAEQDFFKNIMHLQVRIFLKNRMESIRDEARAALAACLKELGLEYLQFIVKVLRATLKRGYELHVLGYTLNFILSKFVVNPIGGKLDYCLEELLSVVENDILGDVSEEKEVEKIASKMKETRKLKSFETLKLIAQNKTFKTCAAKLLLHVTTRLQKHLTPKVKSKLEYMLNNIAAGIECNPSVNQSDLFVFLYTLIEDGITYEIGRNKSSSVLNTSKQSGDETISKIITSARLIDSSQSSHLVRVFALGLLHNRLKNIELHKKDEQQFEMLDPFVRLLTECLTSKYDDIISAALRCLAPLVGLHLPALKSQANKIKTSLLVIAHGSINSSPMMQSCLRLLAVLLRNTQITLSEDQWHVLIQCPLFIDLESNPSPVALSLLKAIVMRKLKFHEIYDLVSRVAILMVTSQVESIRKICSKILYAHSAGRETVLEMLHAFVINTAIKLLIGRVSKNLIGPVKGKERDAGLSILELSLPWYSGGEQHVQSAAAQVLGLLVEVTGEDLKEEYINRVLPVMKAFFSR